MSKPDRLDRNVQNVGVTIKAPTVRKIQVFVSQIGKLALASLAGKLMLIILVAVTEIEPDLLVERT